MSHTPRREFLKQSAALAATGSAVPYFTSSGAAFANLAANDRPQIGCIGVGSMGTGDARAHGRFGDIVAVCDVDQRHAERARVDGKVGNGKADAPGLNKLTSSNAGGLLRGQARAEWARLNASAKKRAEERLDKVRAAVGM